MSWILCLTLLATPFTIDGQLFNLFGLTVTTNKILGDKLTSELGSALAPATSVSSMATTSKPGKADSHDLRHDPLEDGHTTHQGHFGSNCPNCPSTFTAPAPFNYISRQIYPPAPPFLPPDASVSPQPGPGMATDGVEEHLHKAIDQMIRIILLDLRRK